MTTTAVPEETPTVDFIQLTEDEFDAQYTVITPLDANGYESDTVRPTDEGLDPDSKHLWTIVEGDSGNLYAVTGWAFVSRLGYILTEEAWSVATEAEWMIFQDNDEDDDDAEGDNDDV